MARSKQQLARLIRGAMGEIKADLIISGGKLINVYSGEMLDGMEIAIVDGRICYVGASAKHTRGEATEILDATGCYVSPGFIDGHTHIGHSPGRSRICNRSCRTAPPRWWRPAMRCRRCSACAV